MAKKTSSPSPTGQAPRPKKAAPRKPAPDSGASAQTRPLKAAPAAGTSAQARPVEAAPARTGDRDAALSRAILDLRAIFRGSQDREGWWVFDLEADVTITAEYILYKRFMGQPVDPGLRERLCAHLTAKQMPDGGWPLHDLDGKADVSASVKAYLALKVAGHGKDAPHMARARALILSLGGAAAANVFTRITLALFGQLPWRCAPSMPMEIMLLPEWFFFHLSKVSYWSRTVIVPLLILYAHRPVCHLGLSEGVPELFVVAPDRLHHLDRWACGNWRKNLFLVLDRVLKIVEPHFPSGSRAKALRLAEAWMRARMGDGGIGGIFPAMVNAVEALRVLGRSDNDPDALRGAKAVEDLLADHGGDQAFCQPCLSPIWDTCLMLTALTEAGEPLDGPTVQRAVDWLYEKQVFTVGDWQDRAPGLAPGGWAFQFENDHYPDFDDTAMVLMALLRAGAMDTPERKRKVGRAVNWLIGLQGADGGWGAFDKDNNALYLNDIPFADHGALMDPSTSDLTARCIEVMSMLGYPKTFPPIARGLAFLRSEQEASGAWYGRWGVNYLYGTWSVLSALRQVGEDLSQPCVRRAVDWIRSVQNPDGGFGESCFSYDEPSLAGQGASTASQTAWALLGLLAAGEEDSEAVRRGVDYLLSTRGPDGMWEERLYTGTGFPRVFYLRYHGYSKYFPLWALALYQRLAAGGRSLQMEAGLDAPAGFDLPALTAPVARPEGGPLRRLLARIAGA